MDAVLRLLLRFILVPLGYLAAVTVGAGVLVLGSWKTGTMMLSENPDTATAGFFATLVAGPVMFVVIASTMWLPSAVGILISEAFAIRCGFSMRSTARSRGGSAGRRFRHSMRPPRR